MVTTRHPVDFTYTPPEVNALFRYAHAGTTWAGRSL